MNILAIDYGTKNIGLARATTGVDVILPYGRVASLSELVEKIKGEKIDKLVVGLPFGLDGSENKNTERIRNFVEEIKKQVNVPVEFVTEVFSSQAGDRMGAGVSRDEKAAMIILQSYLEKN